MRTAVRQNPRKIPTAQTRSIPAPTGGWDAFNALANMPPQNAVILDNFIPRPTFVELRRGYAQQVTGFTSPVQSLLIYRGAPGGDKILAAAGTKIYDATTSPLGAALYSSATSAVWQYVNFATLAGTPVLIAVNGVDAPISYNGSAITNPAFTGSSGSYTLNINKLLSVCTYISRLFFIENGTLHVWYGGPAAIAGALNLLDLGSVFDKGGRLIACGIWSMNYQVGLSQFIVFLTDQGQIAVYQGTDPSQAADWSLTGVFNVGRPLGPRALVSYGSDLIVLTSDGAVTLSQAMSLDREEDDLVAVTQRIQNAFSQAVRTYRNNFGWEAILYSGGAETSASASEQTGGSLIIVNVPVSALGTSMQFVQAIQNGAWCRFLDINSYCWGLANENIYFGASDGVYQWDIGATDNGNTITGEVLTAFSNYGAEAKNKQFEMIRPLIYTADIITPALDINVNYDQTPPTATPIVVDPGDANLNLRNDWTGVAGIGAVGAVHMVVTVKGDPNAYILGVGDTGNSIVGVGDGGSDVLQTQSTLPFDVPFQLIGFDVLYNMGGPL